MTEIYVDGVTLQIEQLRTRLAWKVLQVERLRQRLSTLELEQRAIERPVVYLSPRTPSAVVARICAHSRGIDFRVPEPSDVLFRRWHELPKLEVLIPERDGDACQQLELFGAEDDDGPR